MTIKPYKSMIQIGNEELNNCIINGAQRSILHHYTNFETLKKILRSKTFMLNRIDKVNDLLEHQFLEHAEVYGLVYVGCFSYRNMESIPHWHMYTKDNEGVRITFALEGPIGVNGEGFLDLDRPTQIVYPQNILFYDTYHGSMCYGKNSRWNIELMTSDILYSKEALLKNPILHNMGGELYSDLLPVAKLKREEWDFEYETRITGIFRTVSENIDFEVPEFILVPINLSKMKLIITLNPWCDSFFKFKIEKLLNECNLIDTVEIKSSDLHNSIRKK